LPGPEFAEYFCEFAVIPERIFFQAIEPFIHSLTNFRVTEVTKDRAGVVHLVAQRHQKSVLVNRKKVFQVTLRADILRFLGLTSGSVHKAVGTRTHDIRYPISEAVANVREARRTALIFDGIVQEGSDGQSSEPPYSSTVAATARRCATYGIEVPLRTWPP
jgi:hypothetical protein